MDNNLLPDEIRIKYEIASELGLTDRLKQLGWKGLTAKETGKIGGILRSRLKTSNSKEHNIDEDN